MPRPVGYVLKRFPRLSQTFVLRELLAQQQAGVPLTVFSYRPLRAQDWHAEYGLLKAEIVALGPDRAADPAVEAQQLECAAARLGDECVRRGIGHLHAHFANVASELARRVAQSRGVTYTVTAHARDIFLGTLDVAAVRRRLHEARAVVTISQFNRDHLIHRFEVPPQRLHLIYNGVRLEDFEFQSDDQREPLILAVGRLIEKKGFEDLIEAVRVLGVQGTAPRLAIIGSGPLEDTLRRQIEAAGLADRATLLGSLAPSQVVDWLGRAGVVAAPCRVGADGDQDGLPTVLLEAMAVGAPCVATPVSGIPEAIEHEVTGLLVAERDPIGLAMACRTLLTDRAHARRLAHRARLRIEQQFDLSQNAGLQRAVWDG